MGDVWASGDAYEAYMGRWSRLVAAGFVDWLGVAPGRRWLDVGCGSGALTAAVLERAEPAAVLAVDRSEAFVAWAAAHVDDPRARFRTADAADLPAGIADVVVSGLVVNFLPDPAAGVAAMAAAAPGGVVAAYVWDYARRMEPIRRFWDAATALDAGAADLDEGRRFPWCRPGGLDLLWRTAGLDDVTVRGIDVPSVFAGFDDYWTPFLGGQGPAPGYVASLDEDRRAALRDALRALLPVEDDGSIRLVARAWAVRGRAPR